MYIVQGSHQIHPTSKNHRGERCSRDCVSRFDSVAAELGAAWLRRWLAPMACADGLRRWLAPMATPMARGRSGSESPSSLLDELRPVDSKEVQVLGESPAPPVAGNQTSLQAQSATNSLRNLSSSATSEPFGCLKSKPRTDLGSDLGSKRRL